MNKADLQGQDLWRSLVATYMRLGTKPSDYEPLVEKLLKDDIDRVEIFRKALVGSDNVPAIYFANLLPISELIQLFPELVLRAVGSEGIVERVRNLILSLPRAWVVENIGQFTEPLLKNGTYVEYRRILELYYMLDSALTLSLAYEAVRNSDPDIKEAGEDFLEKLDNE